MRAHIWKHNGSTHMRAHIWEHTYESTHMRAHRWEHTYESTHIRAQEENRSRDREAHSVRACAVETHRTCHESHFGKFTGKNAGPQARKSHFVWKFTGKCRTPIPQSTFWARLRSRSAHGHFTWAFLAIFFRKNAAHHSAHLDWTPGLLLLP